MIALSVGHHRYSKGAEFEGFYEFDEAKKWVKIIKAILGDYCVLVPEGRLEDKIAFINKQPYLSVAAEIHFNSAVVVRHEVCEDEDEDCDEIGVIEHVGRGCETLYYPGSEKGKAAALIMQSDLSRLFKDRGIKEGYYQLNPSNPVDWFLAKTNYPAIIVEPEFIHRKDKILENRGMGCTAIAAALLKIGANDV